MTDSQPGTELATVEGHGSALVVDAEASYWNDAQLAVLRQIGLEDAGEGDLQVFHHVCQRTGLDPFARQIHMIARNSKSWDPQTRTESWDKKFTIQTGIDGYRLIARRAADRADVDLEYGDTEWCGSDGQWMTVWTRATAPAAARVTVLRDGLRFTAVALYAEYVQTKNSGEPNAMWSRMPANQLAKCAEAARAAQGVPQDLSGIYTDEEMGQADNTVHGEVVPQQSGRRERRQRGGLDAALARRSDPEAVAPGGRGSAPVQAERPSGSEHPPRTPEQLKRMNDLFDDVNMPAETEGRGAYVDRRHRPARSTVTRDDHSTTPTRSSPRSRPTSPQPFPETGDQS
jgi:phage recombination protein Bet